eukprot:TRINITY_DN1401_c0_g1_i1.p2 TRINITY_DN1401_c0_g1~~TRINITY_DN1401_c0_g1_i1.p2  ORF type:complete len:129 (-),score=43.98 TRINITY_DN1401_c0_g1_i1:25-411(-)
MCIRDSNYRDPCQDPVIIENDDDIQCGKELCQGDFEIQVKLLQKNLEKVEKKYFSINSEQFKQQQIQQQDLGIMEKSNCAYNFPMVDQKRKSSCNDSQVKQLESLVICLLYTSPSPRDKRQSRMPSSA